MNLELTYQELNYVIDGLAARISQVEKLIPLFGTEQLKQTYEMEKTELKTLLNKLIEIYKN
jgi:hypothetical protein